jgi:hypothetical protein
MTSGARPAVRRPRGRGGLEDVVSATHRHLHATLTHQRDHVIEILQEAFDVAIIAAAGHR